MTHLFKNINFWTTKHADFIFHEQEKPTPNIYTCANVAFDTGMFFARVWDSEENTVNQFKEGLEDSYGTLSVFYYPESMVAEVLKRIELIKKAILSQKMVSKNLTIEDIPQKDMANIGFIPWIGEHTYLVILTKKYKNGLFVVVNNNDENDCNEFSYFAFEELSEHFNENECCGISGEENTGNNSNFWLQEYPDFLKALNS